MIRAALVVCALWAVIAAPVLCTVGVLAHECECDEVCICDHESDCEADPCSELVARRDEFGTDVEVPAPAILASFVTNAALTEPADSRLLPHPVCAPPPGVPHASDHPLLS